MILWSRIEKNIFPGCKNLTWKMFVVYKSAAHSKDGSYTKYIHYNFDYIIRYTNGKCSSWMLQSIPITAGCHHLSAAYVLYISSMWKHMTTACKRTHKQRSLTRTAKHTDTNMYSTRGVVEAGRGKAFMWLHGIWHDISQNQLRQMFKTCRVAALIWLMLCFLYLSIFSILLSQISELSRYFTCTFCSTWKKVILL